MDLVLAVGDVIKQGGRELYYIKTYVLFDHIYTWSSTNKPTLPFLFFIASLLDLVERDGAVRDLRLVVAVDAFI